MEKKMVLQLADAIHLMMPAFRFPLLSSSLESYMFRNVPFGPRRSGCHKPADVRLSGQNDDPRGVQQCYAISPETKHPGEGGIHSAATSVRPGPVTLTPTSATFAATLIILLLLPALPIIAVAEKVEVQNCRPSRLDYAPATLLALLSHIFVSMRETLLFDMDRNSFGDGVKYSSPIPPSLWIELTPWY
ncbi:hypothetical protein CT0861_06703 [Colletotrichum tofieldiae]|uniref:Uncharacterized protein n=1 Tax=Colletotrichum tofieldiae TaxID=708197 RepID=A0A161W612_9PEZI|nr:hypothetical protein CT0861_06703 [Colletotrichum tofieldiae]